MLPNLFIVGAMKCGTTTIYGMLSRTPGVIMCRIKEPNYFCDDLRQHPDFSAAERRWIRERDEYLRLFPSGNARWRGEASPNYLFSTVAARQIREFNPDARIVIALRNPADRAYSAYNMQLAMGRTAKGFSQTIREDYRLAQTGRFRLSERYIAAGLYAAQVERYLNVFPRAQICLEVIDRPGVGFGGMSRKLTDFLGVPVSDVGIRTEDASNRARRTRLPLLNHMLFKSGIKNALAHRLPENWRMSIKKRYFGISVPEMDAKDRAFLENIFRADTERLSALIGEDLSFWRSIS